LRWFKYWKTNWPNAT